jgi:hypothetical protein
MKKEKLYFLNEDEELCFTEEHFQNIMEQEGLNEIEVFRAYPSKEKGVFWCNEHSFCSDDSSECCGKTNCDEYEPCNGKNGRCKFHSLQLYTWGEKVILKKSERF